jgi:hypothetical protein
MPAVGFLEISEINMAKQKQLSPKYQVWIDARKRHKLSHAHIQMARELGMNPKKFGKLDNHKQEPWKAPLPIFIEDIYFKRFGKERPDNVRSIEQKLRISIKLTVIVCPAPQLHVRFRNVDIVTS